MWLTLHALQARHRAQGELRPWDLSKEGIDLEHIKPTWAGALDHRELGCFKTRKDTSNYGVRPLPCASSASLASGSRVLTCVASRRMRTEHSFKIFIQSAVAMGEAAVNPKPVTIHGVLKGNSLTQSIPTFQQSMSRERAPPSIAVDR